MGEKLDSADFCVMTGQLWERGGLSGTASQRATLAVESLSSAARVRSLGYGFVLHVTLACTAAAGGQVLIRGFHNCGGKSFLFFIFYFFAILHKFPGLLEFLLAGWRKPFLL